MKKEESTNAILELKEILSKFDINRLIEHPDEEIVAQKIWEAESVIRNFDFSDGDRFKKTLTEFIEVARAKNRMQHTINLANDLKHEIAKAIANIVRYFSVSLEDNNVIDGKQKITNGNPISIFSQLFSRNKSKVGDDKSESKGSYLKKEYIISAVVIALLTASSAPWWYSPFVIFLQETKTKIFINYNDLSRVLDTPISNVIDGMEEFSTDEEKQLFIQNYSGLRTRGESGRVINVDTSDNSKILADVDVGSRILTCDFDKKWKQKLSILGELDNILFIGVIDKYDIETGKIMLLYCKIYPR